MARARNIKPSFFKDDRLADLQPLARYLLAGLPCIADRAGRLADRPRWIKAELLPYDKCNVDRLLTDLQRVDKIVRYAIHEERYIQIVDFDRDQNPHIREPESVIPPPDEDPNPKKHGAKPVQAPDKHESDPADSFSADSPSLIPDSLYPDSPTAPDAPKADPDSAQPATSDDGRREMALLKDLKAKGVSVSVGSPLLSEWLQYDSDMLKAAVERARAQKPEPVPIPANYLDAILRDPTLQAEVAKRQNLRRLIGSGSEDRWSEDVASGRVIESTAKRVSDAVEKVMVQLGIHPQFRMSDTAYKDAVRKLGLQEVAKGKQAAEIIPLIEQELEQQAHQLRIAS